MNLPSASSSLCVVASNFDGGRIVGLDLLEHLHRRRASGSMRRAVSANAVWFFRRSFSAIASSSSTESAIISSAAELLAKRLFADGEITVRALQQVILQPFLVVVERGDDGVVRLLELGEECLVGHGGEGGRDRGAEEVAVAVDLLDRDLGVDSRRVVQVLACLGERGGHGLLARNQAAQALLRGRERALDHEVGRVGKAAAVAVRIPRPRPNGFERQDARVDRQEQLLAIELVGGRQRRGIDRSGALPELSRGRDLVERLPDGTDP